METFTELKEFVENPNYQQQRQKNLSVLNDSMIDMPIIGIINALNQLPYCFTLQCCYGHFVYKGQQDPHNIEPLPVEAATDKVEYRIAYIALGIENCDLGWGLFQLLEQIPALDPQNIQFCCADWFWKRHVNSFALQVEPDRFKREDKAILGYKEALYIEKVRNKFFNQLNMLFLKH